VRKLRIGRHRVFREHGSFRLCALNVGRRPGVEFRRQSFRQRLHSGAFFGRDSHSFVVLAPFEVARIEDELDWNQANANADGDAPEENKEETETMKKGMR
jgi:hypothetical protein